MTKIRKSISPYVQMIRVEKKTNHTTRVYEPFYHTERWKKLSKLVRNIHPLCVYCDTIKSSAIADHVLPRRLWPELEYNTNNLVGCCQSCHNKKSAREAGISSKEEYMQAMSFYINKANANK